MTNILGAKAKRKIVFMLICSKRKQKGSVKMLVSSKSEIGLGPRSSLMLIVATNWTSFKEALTLKYISLALIFIFKEVKIRLKRVRLFIVNYYKCIKD